MAAAADKALTVAYDTRLATDPHAGRATMLNFEQIRAHTAAQYRTVSNEPYLMRIELSIDEGRRHQGIFLAELEGDDGRKYLRVSTALAPLTGMDCKRALQFNWEQRVGYLAVSDLDGAPYLMLCENRPYEHLAAAEVDRMIIEIGGLGDRLERAFSAGGDLF